MRYGRLVPVAIAVAGATAIVIGIYQGLIHVAPGYEGTITSGWGGPLGHEERLLARVGVVGVGGAVASRRWKPFAAVPIVAGGVVLFYALRAVVQYARSPGLLVEVSTYGGPVRFVPGAEPFLLVAGGGLLVVAGAVGWRGPPNDAGESDLQAASPPPT
ncbi:MAG: hypothetical protein V5A61_02495 [Haloarculaceae archaeon]